MMTKHGQLEICITSCEFMKEESHKRSNDSENQYVPLRSEVNARSQANRFQSALFAKQNFIRISGDDPQKPFKIELGPATN